MARIYKSARGKMIDMDKVKLPQETTTAVGNMRVNARGDLIGSAGQIAAGRNQIMDQVYAVNSAPEAPYSPNDPVTHAAQQAALNASKAQDLHDLANNLISNGPIEPVSADTPATPPARGSLAGSVAKPTAVTQEPMVDPRASKGPTRI